MNGVVMNLTWKRSNGTYIATANETEYCSVAKAKGKWECWMPDGRYFGTYSTMRDAKAAAEAEFEAGKPQKAATKVAVRDYPSMKRRVVTDAHRKVCVERGHAIERVNGATSPRCPRCGFIDVEKGDRGWHVMLDGRRIGFEDATAGAVFEELLKYREDVNAVTDTDLTIRFFGQIGNTLSFVTCEKG